MLLDLRRRIYRHAQRLSLEFHESYTSGRIIARQTSDLDSIRELLDSGIQGLIRGVLYMVFIAIALVMLDPVERARDRGLAAVPLLLLTRWFQVQLAAVRSGRRACSRRALIVKFVETMTGIRAVKAFRNEKRNEKRVRRRTSRTTATRTRKAIGCSASSIPGLVLIGNVTVAVVLLVGGFRVDRTARSRWARCSRSLHVHPAVLRPDGGDGAVLQLVPVGRRGAREDLGRARRAAERAGPGAAGRPLGRHAARRLRRRPLRVPRRPGRAARLRPAHPRRADGRARRIDGCRQVDARQAASPGSTTRAPAKRRPRRRRPAPAAPEGPAPRHRHGHPGGVPVQRVGRREHRARQARMRRSTRSGLPRGPSVRTTSSWRCPTATTPT